MSVSAPRKLPTGSVDGNGAVIDDDDDGDVNVNFISFLFSL